MIHTCNDFRWLFPEEESKVTLNFGGPRRKGERHLYGYKQCCNTEEKKRIRVFKIEMMRLMIDMSVVRWIGSVIILSREGIEINDSIGLRGNGIRESMEMNVTPNFNRATVAVWPGDPDNIPFGVVCVSEETPRFSARLKLRQGVG